MINAVIMCAIMLFPSVSYMQEYRNESSWAIDFCNKHKEQLMKLNNYLSSEDALIAMCIVAPELSRYSSIVDAAETYALKVLYVQGEMSNFSIGAFQMKPTFAETIENMVAKTDALFKKYEKLLIRKGSAREIRYERVVHLSSLDWQILYLAAFIDIVKARTKNLLFSSDMERLKYWATIYNAGLHRSHNDILSFLRKAGFPKTRMYNYADVCSEFYEFEQYCHFLR